MFEQIIRHGILVTVSVMIICVLGVIAALRIPVQMIPDLETRTITVQTTWSGATPQDIEKEILIEQEEFLRNIPYLEEITSTANTGSAEIELDFPFAVDITETLIRQQCADASIFLPRKCGRTKSHGHILFRQRLYVLLRITLAEQPAQSRYGHDARLH
jgi:multidrug efflux pump subunit AcrB